MKSLITSLSVISVLLGSVGAFAGMGQTESSVESDSASLRGTHKVLERANFRVHEISTDSQTVREYATPDGKVFAVTWRGLGEPNLDPLFGQYYEEYRKAEIKTPTPVGRIPKTIRTPNLVVLKSGQMRNVRGSAYSPKLMPRDFNLNDLL